MNELTIGISQSNYIPWLGYFELISRCDIFVFLESVQYTKNDWRNRNIIRINNQPHWLTVPVRTNNSLNLKLNEVYIADQLWSSKHLAKIENLYPPNKSDLEWGKILREIYTNELCELSLLSEINISILIKILRILDIKTKIEVYDEVDLLDKEARVLQICKSYNAHKYVTTEKGLSYLRREVFLQNEIELEAVNFSLSKKFLSTENSESSINFSIIDSLAKYGPTKLMELFKVAR